MSIFCTAQKLNTFLLIYFDGECYQTTQSLESFSDGNDFFHSVDLLAKLSRSPYPVQSLNHFLLRSLFSFLCSQNSIFFFSLLLLLINCIKENQDSPPRPVPSTWEGTSLLFSFITVPYKLWAVTMNVLVLALQV